MSSSDNDRFGKDENIAIFEACSNCDGKGFIYDAENKCSKCGGSGRQLRK